MVHTDLEIPLDSLFSCVSCVPLKQPYKKKIDISKEMLNDGDIIYIQYKNRSKGVNRTIKKKQMLNVVTIIIKFENKLYNVKIPKSGKIQFTGCKSISSAIYIVGTIIKLLRKHNIFKTTTGSDEVVGFSICVMSNVNIEIPFQIDRDRIHHFINHETDHISILEKSVGYVGVNIKINSNKECKEESTIDKITFKPDGEYVLESAIFSDYLRNREKADKKYKKDMYNSFLVFESGRTIMSGCSSYANRKDAYEKFTNIISLHRDKLCLRDME